MMNTQQTVVNVLPQRITYEVRDLLSRWREFYAPPNNVDVEKTSLTTHELDELIDKVHDLFREVKEVDAVDLLDKVIKVQLQLHSFQQMNRNLKYEELVSLDYDINILTKIVLRHDDKLDPAQYIPQKHPILLALNSELAEKLAEQLVFFDVYSKIITDKQDFIAHSHQFIHSAIIIDIDFDGEGQGLALMKSHQANVPKIFITHKESVSIESRLSACHVGGSGFYVRPTVAQLLRSVEQFYSSPSLKPYKVLIMDDSHSQALFCEHALNRVGMVTYIVTEPLTILDAMELFEPEIIIMDMYMPGCTGTELASVIRQQVAYLRLPILFLSGEGNKDIQLNAMKLGGDDFLTKPVAPKHLVSIVQTRCERGRVLNDLIIRDSLTGLFNHTHILDKLKQACRHAKEHNEDLCFAMVDIDLFKKVNDSYGHTVGDKVISTLSLFLKQRLRGSHSIGRYGGEEFAVVFPNTEEDEALFVMNEIREAFNQLEHSSEQGEFKVSFSCGICRFTGENEEHIIEQADEALYKAKHRGRNNIQCFQF
ncbi:GGDEF domain-containing response regulator [Shewanella surugensis]|uniref:diguanylate cyclase n=1 Tax=Shewanella surugensis TaxID=212020 RepID=A0ABT0LBU6_9GAMM|nr:diguanylate cyclase [Shewanella surugensis]MCL1125177.1 diguanylate cyclase [Shewanella surugensis]